MVEIYLNFELRNLLAVCNSFLHLRRELEYRKVRFKYYLTCLEFFKYRVKISQLLLTRYIYFYSDARKTIPLQT